MKGQIITGQYHESLPLYSEGTIEILIGSKILFIPDKNEHLPPGYDRTFFSGYLMDFNDVRVFLEESDND